METLIQKLENLKKTIHSDDPEMLELCAHNGAVNSCIELVKAFKENIDNVLHTAKLRAEFTALNKEFIVKDISRCFNEYMGE